MTDRPIVLITKGLYTGGYVMLGMGALNTLIKPGAIIDLFRYSSGRFSEIYTLIGVWFVLKVVYQVTRLVWCHNISNDHIFRQAGKWAVITGCTSGLGKEYALQLASKGMNIILISRSQTKLNQLAEEISNQSSVDILTYAADFDQDDERTYDEIKEKFTDMDIGVLVNSAGVSSDPDYLHNLPKDTVMNIINVNLISLAKMCHIFLPKMASRKRGIVLNLASALGTHKAPLLSMYGATKRAVDILTKAMKFEYQEKGVIVQSITPYFISTNMTKHVDTGPLIPDAQKFVRHHLTTVGREYATYGYWPHTVQGWVLKNIPTVLLQQLFYHLKRKSDILNQSKTQNGNKH